jgi:hypothetical protein
MQLFCLYFYILVQVQNIQLVLLILVQVQNMISMLKDKWYQKYVIIQRILGAPDQTGDDDSEEDFSFYIL